MENIEDIIAKKIFQLLNYALAKYIKPDIKIDKVTSITKQGIKLLKQKYEIEGVILDVDDTLRKDMKMLPKCNEEWLDMMKKELKVIVVSNGMDKRIEEFLKEKEIDYIGFANKPLKRNFKKACERMNLKPERVLMIGDSLMEDIYGAKRNNMVTAIVKSVEEEKEN